MKKVKFLGVIIFTFLFVGCSPTMKHTWTKADFTGKNFNNILVVGATKNLESRNTFESAVVELLAEKGIKAKTSLDVFPPAQDADKMAEEEIISRIKKGNYDAVLVASLVNIN